MANQHCTVTDEKLKLRKKALEAYRDWAYYVMNEAGIVGAEANMRARATESGVFPTGYFGYEEPSIWTTGKTDK